MVSLYVLFPDPAHPGGLTVPNTWHIVTQIHGEHWAPNPPSLCHVAVSSKVVFNCVFRKCLECL